MIGTLVRYRVVEGDQELGQENLGDQEETEYDKMVVPSPHSIRSFGWVVIPYSTCPL